ncbi:MAG: DNA primase [Gammaproteobacteria bacterium]|nr:DNA primase [Gammaproteobacteria bacterium]NIR82753.1 DNA primase [Gammaproteobacteria bacterium]NIR89617.1 DNA primase [Gammaproteobacteria bacterium]NIU03913.1 DNA primase [Gammaproteobacteria bacterium]NIV51229.1 DNA primase [Gammaproteobacteria bacterium]
MAGRIPQQFIDELMSRVDIVDVIDERVSLKKQGKDYVACCPFHTEKTPSFSVSPQKQFYHCFGCGAHGTAIGFLMDYAHMEFPEAVEELAARAGMEVPREGGAEARGDDRGGDRSGLYAILERANAYFRRQLREHPEARRAVDYLKGRGLSGEVAAAFQMGFAPPGWENLLRALGHDETQRRHLAATGLVVEKSPGRAYDRFRDRVMFPIHDRRGRVVGFGGRVLGDESPKYLNSPETAVFHKGRELYGLNQARRGNVRLERLLVVEGYMDVVALAQFGIPYAVATLGTAATTEHVERLFRTAPNVVFCFDGDPAGRAAAWRALENALPALHDGRAGAFMFLPEGEDPDSLVRREGREGFEARLRQARPLTDFLFEHLLEQADTASVEGRARLVDLARPLLGRLPAGALHELAIKRLAELSGLDVRELTTLRVGGGAPRKEVPRVRSRVQRTPPSLVRRIITLLLHHPQLAGLAGEGEDLRELALPGVPVLVELLELLAAHPSWNTGAIVEHFRHRDVGTHLAKLAGGEPPALSEGLEQEFKDCIQRLGRMRDEQCFDQLTRKAREAALSPEEKEEYRRLARLMAGSEPRAAKPQKDLL